MDNANNSDTQNTQIKASKSNCNKRGHKIIITFLVLILAVSNIGVYLFMSKQLAQKNNQISEFSNQLNTSNTKITELEGKVKELSDKANKANKEQEPKTSSLSMEVTKAEILRRGGENNTLFVALTLKNNSSNNYEFKVNDLKVKNDSDNTLGVYFAYPELYGYNTSSPLKDQTITTGESVNGFLQIPLSNTETEPQTFSISLIDNTTGVSVTTKAEATPRNL